MQIAYNIDVVKTNVPEALEVLADAVLNPRFTTWEVAEQMEKIEQDIKSLKENPQTVLLEVNLNSTAGEQLCTSAGMQMCILMAFQCMVNVSSWHMTVQTPFKICVIDCAAGGVVCTTPLGRSGPARLRADCTLRADCHHDCSSFQSVQTVSIHTQSCCLQGLHSVAFTGALGRPLICPEGGIHNMSAATLHEFVSTNFIAPKMVLAGAGVEHKALLSLAEPMLSTVEGGSASPQPESKYAGGDYR